MEWALFVAVAIAVAIYIALPIARARRGANGDLEALDADADRDALRAEREALIAALRDLDDDAAAGRITAEDRAAGRRALGPRLRAVTEQLHAAGEAAR